MSKNSVAWNIIFEQDGILEHVKKNGFFRISADRIRKEREPRLMTKFDHAVQLPRVFQKHGLSIQPISRGEYIIGHFDSYFTLPEVNARNVTYRELNSHITTLDATSIYSESSALLCAFHSGMIEDVLGEPSLFTTFGRMSTGSFSYEIEIPGASTRQKVDVVNSQCEIDGGFEGATKYGLLEVKTGKKEDFIIRQLFYPYRLWCNRTTKEVVPIFLTVSNDIFSFHVFRFTDKNVYNSLEQVDCFQFCISRPDITLEDVRDILGSSGGHPENQGLVFPQADLFPRVIDLLGKMNASDEALSKESITAEYAFTKRQTDYYLNAALYLGLVQQEGGKQYVLTQLGAQIMSSHPRKRYLALVERILAQPVFNSVLEHYFTLGREPSIPEVAGILERVRPNVSSKKEGWKRTTLERRAQTVTSWIRWILELTNRIQ